MRRDRFNLSARPRPAEPEPDPDGLDCKRCLRRRSTEDLDRQLWCEACRLAERRVAAIWGRGAGILIGLALALWIAFVVEPAQGRFLIFWAVSVLIVYRLTAKLFQELVYGVIRVRNVPGARAGAAGR